MYDGSAASIDMTVSGEIGLQQSSLGSIGTVGIGQHNWAAAAQHGQHGHNCMLQAAILMRTQPMIFSTIACCRVLCPWGLSQQSSAHGAKLRGPQPKPLAHLPAAGCHAEGALVKNLWHNCLPQGAMLRGPWPKIFGTLACCRVPCQGGLGQKSLAHLPAAGHHAKWALAKNLWHTYLLQSTIPRWTWSKGGMNIKATGMFLCPNMTVGTMTMGLHSCGKHVCKK